MVLETRQAFERLLQERGIYKKFGVSIATVSKWRSALAGVEKYKMYTPTLDIMERALIRYGAKVVVEKKWEI